MTIDITLQPPEEGIEFIGTGLEVTHTPTTQIHRTGQRTNATTTPTAAVTDTEVLATQMPPSYLATHCGGTLPAPVGTVANAMGNISPSIQQKNARYVFNFLNKQGNDIRYINGEEILFREQLLDSGTQQVKVV